MAVLTPSNYVELVAAHSRDLVAFIRPDGTLLYASPAFRTILGHEPADLVGRNFFTLLHPADLASQLEHWPHVAASCALALNCRARHADGGWRWLAASLSDLDGYPEHVVLVAEDITERRRAELQLARLLRHNELILNSITEGMFGVDVHGTATFINAAAARLLGWEPVQFLGRSAHAVLLQTRADGAPFPEQDSPITRTVQVGQIQRVTDGIFWRKDGTSLPVDYICTPIVQSSTIVGAVVVFQDITERQQLQQQVLLAHMM
jgi:PAS domain S-box-containing protein